ncbi:uncharacterized protein LOC141640401 [Silene latifolia]|uniref:uncharacterized protein LOC141640401 n=1 Tax=Silene latifolia TaxID=37657 RepID=UPI003D775BA5
MSTEGAVSLPSTCSTEESFCSSSYSNFLDWEEFHTTFALAEPMIEVYSIRIFKKSFADNHEEKCQVYGTIRVEDLKTNKPFFLYNKDVGDEHLDVISFLHRKLTLIGPIYVFSMEEPSIIFDIRDKATDAAIVVGRACLENATTAEFEKDFMLTIELEGVGSACVDYTALRFGVAASLDFELYPDGDYGSDVGSDDASDNASDCASDDASDSDEVDIDVCGSILAYHSNGYCSRKSASQMVCNKIFETQPSESQVVEFGSPIKLWRKFVAVPAYSSLVIQLNLRDPDTDEPIFVGQTVLETDYCERRMEILGQSCRNYKMFLRARWNQPFMLDESSYDSSLVEEDYFAKLPNEMLVFPQPLLEIFSVFIGRKHCEELNLYGTIQVFDSDLYCTVFEATEKDPYSLPSGCNTILLNGPSRVMYQECFCILIDLMDVKQRIYIKGTASSSDGLKMGHMAWQDRWLSTIVKGAHEDGFAAVNYMAMPYAVNAVVKVQLLSQGGRPDGLYGKIVAFYSAYEYKTDDDREYYRSVLFQRSEDNCFMPNGDNTEVELSRSVFPVPLRSLLYIQMQLKFGIVRGSIDKIVSFKPWQNDSFFDIQANSFAIRVSVEWSYG